MHVQRRHKGRNRVALPSRWQCSFAVASNLEWRIDNRAVRLRAVILIENDHIDQVILNLLLLR